MTKRCRTVNGLVKSLDQHLPATLKVFHSPSGLEGEWSGAWAHCCGNGTLNLGEGRYAQVSEATFHLRNGIRSFYVTDTLPDAAPHWERDITLRYTKSEV